MTRRAALAAHSKVDACGLNVCRLSIVMLPMYRVDIAFLGAGTQKLLHVCLQIAMGGSTFECLGFVAM